MKITVHRGHKVQPVQYESLEFGANVEFDTEDPMFEEALTSEDVSEIAEKFLDELLAKSVDRALRLGGKIEESHLWDFYQAD